MGKAKTSGKRQDFSVESMTPLKVSSIEGLQDYNARAILKDERLVREALLECIEDGDMESFKEILRNHIEAKGVEKVMKKADFPIRTYYSALSESGNPRMDTLFKLFGLAFSA